MKINTDRQIDRDRKNKRNKETKKERTKERKKAKRKKVAAAARIVETFFSYQIYLVVYENNIGLAEKECGFMAQWRPDPGIFS